MAIVDTSSTTSGTSTSTNKTFGDDYARSILSALFAAAGGYDPHGARHAANVQTNIANWQYANPGQPVPHGLQEHLGRIDRRVTPGEAQLGATTPLEIYPESTVVPLDPYTEAAINARAGRAVAGQYGGPAGEAEDYLTSVLSGEYIGSNPYLDDVVSASKRGIANTYLSTTLPQLEARFARAGGRGGAYTGAVDRSLGILAGELGDTEAAIRTASHMQERDLMNQALGYAPAVQQMGYGDVDELERAGREREELAERELNERIARFYWPQDEPFKRFERITQGASDLPLAAGSGRTKTSYNQRTFGTQPYSSPGSTMPPAWERILTGII
jgi:hypothetical protein